MTEQYELILKNEKAKSYRLTRLFILLGNLAGMIFLLLNIQSAVEAILPSLALLTGLFYLLVTTVNELKKKFAHDYWPRIILACCAIAWMMTKHWWMAILLTSFIVLDFLVHRKLMVTVKKDYLDYPAFINQKVDWANVNHVILKDGMLTIDFKDNKLFQYLVMNNGTEINEKEFNEFCQLRLHASV